VNEVSEAKEEVEDLRGLAETLRAMARSLDDASYCIAQAHDELCATLSELKDLDEEGLEETFEKHGLRGIDVEDAVGSAEMLLDELMRVEDGVDELRDELLEAASEVESKLGGS